MLHTNYRPGIILFFLRLISMWRRTGPHFLFFLVFLWTIAVEEQFYIFWGLMMKWGRKYFTELCAGMIMLSLFFRAMNFRDEYGMFANTASVCGDFAVGALLARMR